MGDPPWDQPIQGADQMPFSYSLIQQITKRISNQIEKERGNRISLSQSPKGTKKLTSLPINIYIDPPPDSLHNPFDPLGGETFPGHNLLKKIPSNFIVDFLKINL